MKIGFICISRTSDDSPIDGLWADVNTSDFTHGIMNIAQAETRGQISVKSSKWSTCF